MKVRVANCPSCGGAVEFRLSASLVTVCPWCSCVVARGDRNVEDHGRAADLVATASPLQLGVTGHHRRGPFEIVGRVQYRHPAGGVWDEWYLSFGNGQWGWLAAAQGNYYLTFEKKLQSAGDVPPFESLVPGHRITLGSRGTFTVAETGVAATGGAEGEIPWNFVPDTPHRFTDIHGDDRGFATLDYNQTPPRLFLGHEVSLEELDLSLSGWDGWNLSSVGEAAVHAVSAITVNCPQCGGTLELQAPDKTERVGCPHCSSLLDCSGGTLAYLQTLHSRRVKPVIPLGAVGVLFSVRYTVIGFMERFVVHEGKTYPWTEYLLYNPSEGFRWLVCSRRHWSFVEPIAPHRVVEKGRTAFFDNQAFRVYDRATAVVRYVIGEFYWKVTAGETVECSDYISPPRMVTFERTDNDGNQELNVSLGTYLPVERVESAFGLKNLKRPLGVGTIQPRPETRGVFVLWGWFAAVIILGHIVIDRAFSKNVDTGFFVLMLGLISVIPAGTLIYRHNFEVQRWSDSDYSPYSGG